MIKYHIIGLLCLAFTAFTGIEAIAVFWERNIKSPGTWYMEGKGWLMVLLCGACVYLYFRARKFRKEATLNRNPGVKP